MPHFNVIKENGSREDFDYQKLENSLRKITTDEDLIQEVVTDIQTHAFDDITTREIYRRVYDILHQKHHPTAIKYSLKKSVALLGPTGFPFEKFVAEIFKADGYETLTDQIVKGKCVEHEVDVVAWKNEDLIMVEAKFHADFNLKSDLKIALYVKARYDDIFGNVYHYGNAARKLTEGWLITNTKFSTTAIQYGQCQPALKLVGWNYPYDNNLHHMIEKRGLIPITALTSINTEEKNALLAQGVVLSKSLLNEDIVRTLHLDSQKIIAVQQEARSLQTSL